MKRIAEKSKLINLPPATLPGREDASGAKMPPPSLQPGHSPWYAGGTGKAGTIIALDETFSTMLSKSGVSCET